MSKSANDKLGGAKQAADALRLLSKADQDRILSQIQSADPDRAQDIASFLIQLEDISKLDQKNFGILLQNLNERDLHLALRGCSDSLKQYLKQNLPQRRYESILTAVDEMGPQRKQLVEEAQQKICSTLLKLEEEGKIKRETAA